jgi:hypothetical protein
MSSPATIMPAPQAGLLEFIQTLNPGQATAIADQLIQLPFPARYIRVVACNTTATQNTAFLHLAKLGKVYSGVGILMNGGETWIPLGNTPGGVQNKVGFTIKLCKPISQFYLDLGFEAGAGVAHNLTFLVSNAIDFISDQYI